jgi:hypothetical protein
MDASRSMDSIRWKMEQNTIISDGDMGRNLVSNWAQIALAVVGSVLASSGFWAYVTHKVDKSDATTRLLMGIAYNELIQKGLEYIEHGWVTKDEYEEYRKYFYEPYKELGGNGVAERIMNQVTTLPIMPHGKFDRIFRQPERFINNVRVVSRAEQEAPVE